MTSPTRPLKSARWPGAGEVSTPEGKILLNFKLIQVPKGLIDYVVMHELCHLKEHHHGVAFYALLGRAMPDWQERRQRLNEMDVG